jgi:hypothetical protein
MNLQLNARQESLPELMHEDTFVFVDVDGVLNVGARDTGMGPLILSDANIRHCRRLWPNREQERECDSIKRVMAMCNHQLGHGEDDTYTKLATSSPSHVSDVLVARLAKLITMAGPRTKVVLSSTWQRPQHRAHRMRLEDTITKFLGIPFVFDATTESNYENNAEGRLQAIGRYLARNARRMTARSLRVLVLEDFYITRMGVWACDGAAMHSPEACELYLRQKAFELRSEDCDDDHFSVAVKVVHTYDEWLTDEGLPVQVGCGLTMEHYKQAKDFLSNGVGLQADCHPCTQDPAAVPDLTNVPATFDDEPVKVKKLLQVDNIDATNEDETIVYTNGRHSPWVLSSAWPWLAAFMLKKKTAVH